MTTTRKAYNPSSIEPKWQKVWAKNGIYKQYSRKKKFYVLDMFPYPSGAGLHVGHPKGYIATDTLARMKQLQGYSVLHPMGWDAFGLPAEQYALKNKVHPEKSVKENIATFKKQLGKIGFTYDWDREINTTDPEYYKWTQWIFLKLWEHGLAYESQDPINWCPSCKTGLANEDLENGRCERCSSIVEKRPLRQWVLRMTKYADRLLHDLDTEKLRWSESIKEQQRNWIGRSEGTEVVFYVADTEEEIQVYTTRVDTVFGCTYLVIAPEHPMLKNIEYRISNRADVEKYIKKTVSKSDLERTELSKEKTGIALEGIEVVHPFTGKRLPVFVADYVLGGYGTGAVMGVPAHDERDFGFAKKYNLEIERVIWSIGGSIGATFDEDKQVWIPQQYEDEWNNWYANDGVLQGSGKFSGLTSQEAREKMTAWLKKEKLGKKKVNYKMRDWTFSRQRYWGEPIPLIHCKKCGVVAVPEKDLPVKLPKVKSYEPTDTGESPLASIASWVNVKCPKCKGKAKRETNTMPQWAGSCWYYLRFIDPKNKKALVDKKKEKKMMPVDVYVGGTEHATRHLLYARFWHKFLYDIKVVSGKEPFQKLVNQGLILAVDGKKMSKRWGNVINPDDMVGAFGADAFRLYEMFMGPFVQSIAWNTDGVVGTRRFLDKVWKLQEKVARSKEQGARKNSIESLLHQTIKKVTEDIENFKFNTAVSTLMILINALEKEDHVSRITYQTALILLSPFAPHIAEELWYGTGEKKSIFLSTWPKWDAKKIVEEEVIIAVQVNGKVRATLHIAVGSSEEEVKKRAMADPKINGYVSGKEIHKIIYIQDKILSLVL
jgi:leucyl-tRNA synthetase